MRTIIIAPHPDDEWIGCGCTMLKLLEENGKIVVLLVTRAIHSEKRAVVSKGLAKDYGYGLKILGEPEKNIDDNKLTKFFRKNIKKGDIIYVPDIDLHPDHIKISANLQKNFKNEMYQYCVYNNSLNPIKRLKNIVRRLLTGNTPSSFRTGKEDTKLNYKVDEKNINILKFGEAKRESDILRRIKNGHE